MLVGCIPLTASALVQLFVITQTSQVLVFAIEVVDLLLGSLVLEVNFNVVLSGLKCLWSCLVNDTTDWTPRRTSLGYAQSTR